MREEIIRISFAEFAANLDRFFQYVIEEQEPVVVENEEGKGVETRPLDSSTDKRTVTDGDWAAFRAAAGSWADVDTDAFLKDIYESRKSSRPPVDL